MKTQSNPALSFEKKTIITFENLSDEKSKNGKSYGVGCTDYF